MPLVIPESTPIQISAKPRLLMCRTTGGSDAMLEPIRAHGYGVMVTQVSRPVLTPLRTLLSGVDILLLDVTQSSRDVLDTIDVLNASVGIGGARPRLLCFSTAHRNPHFVIEIEKCGARYVRVSGSSILLEAIDLLLAEMNELQHNGLCFQIIHRFSQGSCAPGEEVSAALLVHHGEFFQLPLAVVERLVFDLLAQHRRIAMDSMQIVSSLSGDWFYRDHASNSGRKQVKKIRRAAVKVLVQRIREAIASTFAKAGLRSNPYDVLRSCPAEGTNRVLYRLHGDVRWHHVNR
jgi:hypothetical protein